MVPRKAPKGTPSPGRSGATECPLGGDGHSGAGGGGIGGRVAGGWLGGGSGSRGSPGSSAERALGLGGGACEGAGIGALSCDDEPPPLAGPPVEGPASGAGGAGTLPPWRNETAGGGMATGARRSASAALSQPRHAVASLQRRTRSARSRR